ncbi:DUF1802 family protein [Deinococcus koreensis]|uniref:DUF1802 domain-containing protein n=1 Tax=Deinococcus koreensis TaxID=2054903 RepID=A0A2K3UYI1_9DEIO|nr:DUF1802 family protein [Deinococcus koreensis]PNY81575.1 hypothetical protein CVO96_09490 [Deinococcus koreensis]
MSAPATALKEWDAQCSLLTSGEVSVLVRKGGIMETHDGFEVERRSFLLYPTFLHQNPAELKPEHSARLRPDPDPGRIHLPALAEVVAVHKVESLEAARALEPWQALSADAIERKFHYRGRPWVHALVLRVRPLLQPLVLEETPDMLGCVSWVPLGELDVTAGEGVLDEAELQARAAGIEAGLRG